MNRVFNKGLKVLPGTFHFNYQLRARATLWGTCEIVTFELLLRFLLLADYKLVAPRKAFYLATCFSI